MSDFYHNKITLGYYDEVFKNSRIQSALNYIKFYFVEKISR